jgi:3',5'-cyclic-AMP phosphodiesterase
MKNQMTRRQALATSLAGTVALTSGNPTANAAAAASGANSRRPALTFAHLTDTHVQPEKGAQAGLAKALHHIQAHSAKPSLILAGGDNIMDALGQDRARTAIQWKLWRETLASDCSLPVRSCIGNHDVWGWNREKSRTTGTEPGYGKQWAMDELGLTKPYHSFDQAGWHFVVLDSTHSDGGTSYVGKLDEEQFAWLAEDLARTPISSPVLILSHIPLIAACAYFDGENEKSGNWVVPGAWMHLDARRLKDLFRQHPQVKLCLSGHIHLVDQVQYLGVTYACNGAVSGGWWDGPCQEFNNGYGLVTLYHDGSFRNEYVEFGWTPQA